MDTRTFCQTPLLVEVSRRNVSALSSSLYPKYQLKLCTEHLSSVMPGVDESYSRLNVRARAIAEQSYYVKSVSADESLDSVRVHTSHSMHRYNWKADSG